MANNWFQRLISPYERQLQRQDSSRTMQITIGTNVPATWESSDKLWFVSEWMLPLLPTSGAISGNRGQIISFGMPLSIDPMWKINIHDYDVSLRDQLSTLAEARTSLRIWAWAQFVAVGVVADVGTQMPLDKVLGVTFALSGLRRIKASAYNKDVVDFDLSTPIHLLDMPFALTAGAVTTYQNNTTLYGTEILP